MVAVKRIEKGRPIPKFFKIFFLLGSKPGVYQDENIFIRIFKLTDKLHPRTMFLFEAVTVPTLNPQIPRTYPHSRYHWPHLLFILIPTPIYVPHFIKVTLLTLFLFTPLQIFTYIWYSPHGIWPWSGLTRSYKKVLIVCCNILLLHLISVLLLKQGPAAAATYPDQTDGSFEVHIFCWWADVDRCSL